MARITIGQKAERVLKLLYGLRNRRAADVLGAYGFSEEDRKRGWTLLEALTTDRLRRSTSASVDPKIYDELDAWENRWFPISDATLTANAPAVRDWLFMNLQQTDGIAVAVSVGTFVARIDQLATTTEVAGATEARALLQRRGLTPAVIDAAKTLLAKLQSVADLPAIPPIDMEAQLAKENALWTWYLEWSQIARTVIRDKTILRELGFIQSRKAKEEEAEDEIEDTTPVGPAPSASATQAPTNGRMATA